MTVPAFNLALKVKIISLITDTKAGWLAERFVSPWWQRWLTGDDLYGCFFWVAWLNDLGHKIEFKEKDKNFFEQQGWKTPIRCWQCRQVKKERYNRNEQ